MSLFREIIAKRCLVCNRRINKLILCQWCIPKKQINKNLNYCSICQLETEYNVAICNICKIYMPPFLSINYLWDYDIEARNIITAFKYHNNEALLNYTSKLAIKYLKNESIIENIDLIIPMPESKKTALKRNYNPCALISRKISKEFNIRNYTGVLLKNKLKKPQAKLAPAKRISNIKNSLEIKKSSLNGKNILLIEDVITTGASIKEACNLLIKNKAKSVRVFSVARSPNWKNYRGMLRT